MSHPGTCRPHTRPGADEIPQVLPATNRDEVPDHYGEAKVARQEASRETVGDRLLMLGPLGSADRATTPDVPDAGSPRQQFGQASECQTDARRSVFEAGHAA